MYLAGDNVYQVGISVNESNQNIENFNLSYLNFLGYPSNIVVTISLGQELK